MDDTRIIESNPVRITELRFNGEPFSPEYIHSWMNAIVSMTGWKETAADWKRKVSFKLGKEEFHIADCFPHSFDVEWSPITASSVFDLSLGVSGHYRSDLPPQVLALLPLRPRRPSMAAVRGFAYAGNAEASAWCIDDILFRIRENGLATIYLKQEAYGRA